MLYKLKMQALYRFILLSMTITVVMHYLDSYVVYKRLIPTKLNSLIIKPSELKFSLENKHNNQINKQCSIKSKPKCKIVPTTRIVCEYYT